MAEETESSEPRIYSIRGESVVLDEDVARLFGTTTGRLNEQAKRNQARFGDDFAFQLTMEEFDNLRSQNATSSLRRPPLSAQCLHRAWRGDGRDYPQITAGRRRHPADRAIFHGNRKKARLAQAAGSNLPANLEMKSLIPLAVEMRQRLMGKINTALTRVLDAIADPVAQTTVRDEARQLVAEGLNSIKEHLKTAGINNEKTVAEIRKLLAEADAIDAETQQKHIDAKHRERALLAKQLRLIRAAQRYFETGTAETLEAVLRDLGSA